MPSKLDGFRILNPPPYSTLLSSGYSRQLGPFPTSKILCLISIISNCYQTQQTTQPQPCHYLLSYRMEMFKQSNSMKDQSESVQPINPNQSEESSNSLFKSAQQDLLIQSLTGREKKEDKDFPLLSNIENGNEVKFYHTKLMRLDDILLLLNIMTLLFTIIYADSDYYNRDPDNVSANLILLVLVTFMVLSVAITFFRYQAIIKIGIARFELSTEDSLWNSDKIPVLVMDLLILLLQPYPFLNNITISAFNVRDNYSYQFKLNYALSIACFFKILIIARALLQKTTYMTPRSYRVCKLYEADNDFLYAIKGLFMDSPMMLIGVSFIVSIVMFALIFRICERELIVYDKINGVSPTMDLENVINVFWFTIITMTTVGYGDMYPRTLMGRIIDVVLIIWGSVIVSLIIVVLTNSLTMDMSQKRALTVLNRLELKSSEREQATNRIGIEWRIKQLQKKLRTEKNKMQLKKHKKVIDDYILKKHDTSKQIKKIKQQTQSMLQFDDLYQQLTRQFDSFIDEVNKFIDNQIKVEVDLAQFINKNLNESP